MKKIVEKILKILASAVLKKYKPRIIGVTGSMGKTSTKEAIFAVLSSKFNVRRNIKNYNNEIGVPLTILNCESGKKSLLKWLGVFLKGLDLVFLKNDYPEILILEMGADKPGDIKYLMSFINPDIGVITGIGEVPVHVEAFGTPAQVAREKVRLIEFLEPEDFAVLNFDDEKVKNLASKTKSKVFGYGFGDQTNIRAINYDLNIGFDPTVSGISFKIEYDGNVVPIKFDGIFGEHQVYPMLGGCAVGLALGIDLAGIVGGLKRYEPPKGRMRLLEGIKQTWIIDDSYNASPVATLAALKTLSKFDGRRKIAVLGDMMELGGFMESEHKKIGAKVKDCADIFFAVGERMAFAADEAKKTGMQKINIHFFDTAESAGLALQRVMQKGDVILIKGSQSMRMEKIAEEIMAHPELASDLLVRQEKEWKER